jgi:uncharacterized protein YeaO (DUF488 family)
MHNNTIAEMRKINVKRIYEEPSDDDGYRVLVDRLWPRGISKNTAKLDDWNKEIAPSSGLRKWFDHKEERFEEFTHQYKEELKLKEEALNALRELSEHKTVSLLYAAKDPHLNQAIVLRSVLLKKEKERNSSPILSKFALNE